MEAMSNTDTEADCNVLPLQEYKKCAGSHNEIRETKINLLSYGGSKIKALVDLNVRAILGLEARVKLKSIDRVNSLEISELSAKPNIISLSGIFKSKEDVLNNYSSVFNGLGVFPMEYSMKLKDNAIPKVFPIRTVPHSLLNQYKISLDKLEKQGEILL
ncbi:hypothetical protein QE152_g20728 [Popillia japonica]|uniref:Uncharacterized protein n=1 Tax=Popillia japonica TaxID=7064 RepID=A0AAW1KPK1_POPJA